MIYKAEFEDNPEAPVASCETFLRVWSQSFPYLVVPKYNSLGACDLCSSLNGQLHEFRKKNCQEERKNVGFQLKMHLDMVRDERRDKIKRDQNAAKYPSESWSIGVDQMQDQFLPYFTRLPKSLWRKNRPAVKVIGYAAHGPAKNVVR